MFIFLLLSDFARPVGPPGFNGKILLNVANLPSEWVETKYSLLNKAVLDGSWFSYKNIYIFIYLNFINIYIFLLYL